MTIRPLLFLVCFTVCLRAAAVPPGDAPPLERFEFTQLLMGVEARVTLFADDEESARGAAAAAFARIAELDAALSDYRPDSELMRLCARAGTGPVRVGDDLFEVLRVAREVSLASDGAFDVTVGPAVVLWREARRTGRLPEEASLREARALVDWRLVRLNESERTVDLARAGMRLDLGGIGKGYAAQEAVEILKARGAERCLVALAGDIAAGGPPPGAEGWSISLQSGGKSGTLLLANAAVSTSGDTEQFVEIGGTRYSHVVDPRSGLGAQSRARATVIAPGGATADALASTLTVIGVDGAAALMDRFPDAAAAVEQPGTDAQTDTTARYVSDAFPGIDH